jgi:hypothetical protein
MQVQILRLQSIDDNLMLEQLEMENYFCRQIIIDVNGDYYGLFEFVSPPTSPASTKK